MRRILAFLALATTGSVASAQESHWQSSVTDGFEIRTASPADSARLSEAIAVLRRAAASIREDADLQLCHEPVIVIHPDLESFTSTTQLPWFILAAADRTACRIDTQRARVLEQHGGLTRTLLHELHHLAQPEGWQRWQAEGWAQLFAGEQPNAAPLDGLTPIQLDRLLAAPGNAETYLRALATALRWVMEGD